MTTPTSGSLPSKGTVETARSHQRSAETDLSFDHLRAVLDAVIANFDPAEANRDITRVHHELSILLGRRLGPDAGANFHTWAVWGSREAATTIGRNNLKGVTAWVALITGAVGALLGAAIGHRGVLSCALIGAVTGAAVTRRTLDRARHHVAHGNRIVVDEIGGLTAKFVTAFAHDTEVHADHLSSFLSSLRPGPSTAGGQDELGRAFAAYHRAAFEPDLDRKHQLVFAANCRIVAHEHIRLQHDIATAMPWPLRRWITRTLLDYHVGPEVLHVARDLTSVDGASYPYPSALVSLTEPEARDVVVALRDRHRPEGSLAGSGATDWSSYPQRMNYVVELFRSRHLSPAVFAAPYDHNTRPLFAPA